MSARLRAASPPADGSALHIDWTLCDGRGLCTEMLENALERDRWGYPLAVRAGDDRSTIPLAAGEADAARDAVALCPLRALRLVERG